MSETIEWLIHIRMLARDFYREASGFLCNDEEMSKFLLHLADKQSDHLQAVENALDYVKHNVTTASAVTIDEETKKSIESHLIRSIELLKTGRLERKTVLDCLAATEFSEWNDVFMNIIGHLRKEPRFGSMASGLRRHLTELENFFRTLPEGEQYIPAIRKSVFDRHEKILVIDDEPSILAYLKNLLSDEGNVDTAANGREALQKVTDDYFDVILTDLKMPVMDGIEFYKQALEHDPNIGRRIIFYSGMTGPDHAEFFRKNNLRYLPKPAPIREILKHVHEIVQTH